MSKRPVSCWSWKRSGVLFCCPPRKVTVRPQVPSSSQSDHFVIILTVRLRCHPPHVQTTLSSSSQSDHFVILLTVRPHMPSSSQSDNSCHPPHSQTTVPSSSQSNTLLPSSSQSNTLLPSSSQSDHACHHPHRYNVQCYKSEKWYGNGD